MKAQQKNVKFDLESYMRSRVAAVNKALDEFLHPVRKKPSTLYKAMRYSTFAGGKRIRPLLCLAAAEACGGDPNKAMPLACAVECVHTYSLIHDDLPAMDNDDFRRGRPTCHRVFGEAMAILAGDALLAFAFELACHAEGTPRYPTHLMVRELAKAAGPEHLVAGQVCDLEAEGKQISAKHLRFIHERKTGALIRCAVRLGGMSANCTPSQLNALSTFGHYVGLAFQVIDDILDVTQTSETLGKTAGKDVKAGKATYPSILGLEKSKKIAARLTAKAFSALEGFGDRAMPLLELGRFLLCRSY
jgi:geranylgeranyl diphosphate synthase type II